MNTQEFKSLTDDVLFVLIKSGSRPAFDELYLRYWERLFLYLVKVIKDVDETEDIVQEVFVSLWNRGADLPEVDSVSAYLFSAVRFRGLSFLSKKARMQALVSQLAVNDSDQSLESQQYAKDINHLLEKTLQALPLKMREVFTLSRKEEMSHKEIATVMNISDKTVKKQISNALKIFRLTLEREKFISLFLHLLTFYTVS